VAAPGHYKAVQSSNPLLEVKRAGKKHLCAGIAVERGARPGKLQDVWMIGRSRHCTNWIKANDYYVANKILPQRVLAVMPSYDQFWPTCLPCAIETYPEFFSGPLVREYLRPVTPEHREKVRKGLRRIVEETQQMAIPETSGDVEAA
jgi:hypothetical protein